MTPKPKGHECMSPATHGGIGCSQCGRLWDELRELTRERDELVRRLLEAEHKNAESYATRKAHAEALAWLRKEEGE